MIGKALGWLVVLGLTIAFPVPMGLLWACVWYVRRSQRQQQAARLERQRAELAEIQQGTEALQRRFEAITGGRGNGE